METQLGCADPTESTHSEFCRVAKMRMRTGGNDRASGDYERSGHHGSPAIFFRSGPGICLDFFVRFSKIFRRAWGAVMYSESVRKTK